MTPDAPDAALIDSLARVLEAPIPKPKDDEAQALAAELVRVKLLACRRLRRELARDAGPAPNPPPMGFQAR